MPKDDQHAGSTATSSSRWYLFVLTLMAVVIGVALFISTRSDNAEELRLILAVAVGGNDRFHYYKDI